jgi:hypothetical protein
MKYLKSMYKSESRGQDFHNQFNEKHPTAHKNFSFQDMQ